MAAQSIFTLILMAMGHTMAFSIWNLWSAPDLRQMIPYECTGVGAQSCQDCFSFPYCTQTGQSAFNIQCGAGKVCQIQNGGGSCLDSANPAALDCICTSNGFMDDPYELFGNKYLECTAGQTPVAMKCPEGEAFDFTSSACITAPPLPDCTEPGLHLYGCLGAYFCPFPGAQPDDVNMITCQAGELFDIASSDCIPTEDVKIDDFTCSASSLDGAIADTIECNAFYICLFGEQQGNKLCCPEGEFFSASSMTCTTDLSQVQCPEAHPCDIHEYEQVCSAPPTSPPTTTELSTDKTTSQTAASTSTTTIIPSSSTTISTTASTITTTITPSSSTTSSTTLTTTTATTTTRVACGVLPSCNENGAYPYSCSCTKYFWCAGGRASVQNCPGQLRFNPTTRYCDTAENVPVCA
ncbi:hypothetical protein SK128_003675 [Halocaridina rubra]|uniref:Chitin-binding type-2 domain-containing protein n=1 Tax=Halocaridina rubra TaxID=373956 RepID=A0AAN8XB55_HALRR